MLLNAHVEGIELEGGRAAGVRLRGGARIRARRAVVSNASMWDTQARFKVVSIVTCMRLDEWWRRSLCTHVVAPLVAFAPQSVLIMRLALSAARACLSGAMLLSTPTTPQCSWESRA